MAYLIIHDKEIEARDAQFVAESQISIQNMRSTLEMNAISLNALKGYFEVSHAIDEGHFRDFVKPLLADHPTLAGYGWLPKIAHSERADFETTLREAGVKNFIIREGDGGGVYRPSPILAAYHPVKYAEPNLVVKRRIGLNIASLPLGGPGIRDAIESAELVASGPITSTRTFDENATIMLFNAVNTHIVDGKEEGHTGIVMALFRVSDMIESQFNEDKDITFHVEEVTDPENVLTIFGFAPTDYEGLTTEQFSFAGREWRVTSTTHFAKYSFHWLSLIVLISGLIITAITTLALRSLTLRRQVVESLVLLRTSELEKTADKLTQSNDDLAHFAQVCSHDMQAPLRVISCFSEMLEGRLGDALLEDEESREYLNQILKGATQARALIIDILEYSRADTEDMEPEIVDLNRLFDDMKKNADVTLDGLAAELSRDPLPKLRGTQTQFHQLFSNLIRNGLKYQKSDTVPNIHVSVLDCGTHWKFGVKDNGIGIRPENLEKVFGMFARLPTQANYEGSGIGLSTCKKIVLRHGGEIWVESTFGKGSTFFFTILKSAVGEDIFLDEAA